MNLVLNNKFIPRLDRSIDTNKRVSIYRNLNGGEERKYSIKQNGLVVGYTNQIMLHDCKCHVRESGREKVLKNRHKNVHAHITGFVNLGAVWEPLRQIKMVCPPKLPIIHTPTKNSCART